MAGITLVGLGSGAAKPDYAEVQEFLRASPEVWVTSPDHPVIAALPETDGCPRPRRRRGASFLGACGRRSRDPGAGDAPQSAS